MKTGDRVLITNSWSSDVTPGAIGTVIGRRARGYAVEITGWFHDAFGKGRVETRCLYFNAKQIKKLTRHTPQAGAEEAGAEVG